MATTYLQRFLILVISTCEIVSIAYAESGRTDYDLDDDGLIEINGLADLNEIRNNLDGTSLYGESTGCPAEGCNGFELTTTLDFDTNADGVMDENDEYWNNGEGWEPIGDYNFPFTAIFDGNGYQILNLYIQKASTNFVGLFGYARGETVVIRDFGITGELMNVNANLSAYVGAFTGVLSEGAVLGDVYSTGSVSGSSSTGGLIGRGLSDSSIVSSFSTCTVNGGNAGGLAGNISDAFIINNSFSTGEVNGTYSAGGLVGRTYSGNLDHRPSFLKNSFSSGKINGELNKTGGMIGVVGDPDVITISNSYWSLDLSGQNLGTDEPVVGNYLGITSAELQCPTSSDDSECLISNTLYASWDTTVWDFGSSQELPGLIIDGVIYRDSDGDGSLDGDDAFPNNRAGSVDNDGDGYPDIWTTGCDAECRSTSGLTLDQFPMTSAAWLDADLDSQPDSWAAGCDASCQNDSGLTLDTSLNDVDNDGVIDSQDSDTNGVLNADADSNGLIEVSTLEQLNAVRYNLNGAGRTLSEGGDIDSSGCPAVILEGTLQRHCAGYELTTTLDFDTNADGVMDENDTYWNDGEGWQPIGDQSSAFNATFDGNGHQIRNLYIDRPSTGYVGLFGYVKGEAASLRNLGLTGKLMSVTGGYYVGGLAGHLTDASVTQSYSTGIVTGDGYVGGLAGRVYRGSLNNSFATGSVTGDRYVGGLAGESSNSSLNNSFATGYVNGNSGVGGLIGQNGGNSAFSIINSHWATDTTGQAFSDDEAELDGYFGAALAELQCPTSSDDAECLISNTLYASWDSSVWDFGSNQELPGLIIDGVVYRDSDGDGSLDINQPPDVTLVLKQDGDVVPDVIVGAGDVTIEAVITDPDASDDHTLTWTLSDVSIMGETDNTSASFSSDNIPDGEYTVAVVATDNRYSPLSDDASITFTVERNASSAPENSTSSGSSGGGGALGVFWVLMGGLLLLVSRRSHVFYEYIAH